MSAITALVTGVLSRDPQSRTTSKGQPMAMASISCLAGEPPPVYIGLLAFNELAEELSQCAKGDSVSVRGRLELNRWATPEGEVRERWQIVADSLIAGPARPSKTRPAPRRYQDTGRTHAPAEPPPYDDEIAF